MDIARTDAEGRPVGWSRRKFLRIGSAAALAAGAGSALYAWRIEPHWVEFTHRRLPIRHLPSALQGSTLVQLSDLHVGPSVDSSYVVDVFQRVAALRPDLVAVTGDFVTYSGSETVDELGRVLEHLPRGSRATIGILGNHDYGRTWRRASVARAVEGRARDAGARVLRNAVLDVDGLRIIGLDDLWSHNFRPRAPLELLRPEDAAITLLHNPDGADRNVWGGYRGWILAGHTHGGQCKPPFLDPPVVPVRNKRYTAGEFDLGGGRFMYINRGIGHTLRVRFNARPEVTVFTLTAA